MKYVCILFVLFVNATVAQVIPVTSEPTIFIKYDNSVGEYRIGEDLTKLAEIKKRENIAIRICSNLTLPEALLKAPADPLLIAEKLINNYAFNPENIYFLLLKNCDGNNKKQSVEIWLVSNKQKYPPSEVIINSTQVNLIPIGTKKYNRGMLDYKAASKRLLKELQSNPNAFGVVRGYFLQNPSSILKKRLKEVKSLFERSNISDSKYILSLEPWLDEISTYPKDKEPVYPNIYLLTISLKTGTENRSLQ